MSARLLFVSLLRLLKARCGRKYTAIARTAELHPSNVCAIIQGRRPPQRERDKLDRLAAALGVQEGTIDETEFRITAAEVLNPWVDEEVSRSAHDRLHVRMRQLLRTSDVPLTAEQEERLAQIHVEVQALLPQLRRLEDGIRKLEAVREAARRKQNQLMFTEPPE